MNFINDFGSLLRKYSEPKNTDDFWLEVVNAASMMGVKYPDCKQIILGWLDGLEEKATGNKVASCEVRKRYWNEFYLSLKSGRG